MVQVAHKELSASTTKRSTDLLRRIADWSCLLVVVMRHMLVLLSLFAAATLARAGLFEAFFGSSNGGAPEAIHANFAWMKETTWLWNEWRDVTFKETGLFEAPTQDCEEGRCKWSASDSQVFLQWGDAGMHVARTQLAEAREGNTLWGDRHDGESFSASFRSKGDVTANHYDVLGLAQDCSEQEIKQAYRKLSKLYHPDKAADGSGDQERFGAVQLAYETLGDADKRTAYDSFGGRKFSSRWEMEQAGVDSSDAKLYAGRSGEVVTAHTYHTFVHKEDSVLNLVDFYAPWCGHCMDLAPEYKKAAIRAESRWGNGKVKFGAVNCDAEQALCGELQIHSFPTIMMYKAADGISEEFSGQKNADSLFQWVEQTLDSNLVSLTASTFAQLVTDDDSPWLVDFSAGDWCGPCTNMKRTLRPLSAKLKGAYKVGVVACDDNGENQQLCQQLGIQAYPKLMVYSAGVGEAKLSEGLPNEYNLQDSIFLDIWASGVRDGRASCGAAAAAGAASEEREAADRPNVETDGTDWRKEL